MQINRNLLNKYADEVYPYQQYEYPQATYAQPVDASKPTTYAGMGAKAGAIGNGLASALVSAYRKHGTSKNIQAGIAGAILGGIVGGLTGGAFKRKAGATKQAGVLDTLSDVGDAYSMRNNMNDLYTAASLVKEAASNVTLNIQPDPDAQGSAHLLTPLELGLATSAAIGTGTHFLRDGSMAKNLLRTPKRIGMATLGAGALIGLGSYLLQRRSDMAKAKVASIRDSIDPLPVGLAAGVGLGAGSLGNIGSKNIIAYLNSRGLTRSGTGYANTMKNLRVKGLKGGLAGLALGSTIGALGSYTYNKYHNSKTASDNTNPALAGLAAGGTAGLGTYLYNRYKNSKTKVAAEHAYTRTEAAKRLALGAIPVGALASLGYMAEGSKLRDGVAPLIKGTAKALAKNPKVLAATLAAGSLGASALGAALNTNNKGPNTVIRRAGLLGAGLGGVAGARIGSLLGAASGRSLHHGAIGLAAGSLLGGLGIASGMAASDALGKKILDIKRGNDN